MSIPVDTFDEGLRKLKLGRRFYPDAPKAFGGLFSLVEPHADVLRDRLAEELGPSKFIPEILTGVNDDSTFNAVAVRLCATQYIISVNYGTLILIHDLTHRLFCLPEFFPWVGDPSKEDMQRQFHPTSANAQTYMRIFLSDPRPVIPRDPQRQRAAQSLIHFVVMFLVAHEFRHIMGGHLAWLGSRSDRQSIAECPQADSSEGLTFQALEMDADSFAMYYTLLQALGGHFKTGHRWAGQNRPMGGRPGLSCFTLPAPSSGKPVFVRQLLGPHFSRCPW